jgi:hypothetical protein
MSESENFEPTQVVKVVEAGGLVVNDGIIYNGKPVKDLESAKDLQMALEYVVDNGMVAKDKVDSFEELIEAIEAIRFRVESDGKEMDRENLLPKPEDFYPGDLGAFMEVFIKESHTRHNNRIYKEDNETILTKPEVVDLIKKMTEMFRIFGGYKREENKENGIEFKKVEQLSDMIFIPGADKNERLFSDVFYYLGLLAAHNRQEAGEV